MKKKEPKYAIGQEVWLMEDNKPTTYIVEGIVKRNDVWGYLFFDWMETVEWKAEHQIFPDKKSLIESL